MPIAPSSPRVPVFTEDNSDDTSDISPELRERLDNSHVDPVTMTVHDCRRYNQTIAPSEIRSRWDGYDEEGNWIGEE